MSTKTISYIQKLNSNLEKLKKEVKRINSLPEEIRQQEIIELYLYFKQKTDVKVKLFDEDNKEIYECLNVNECIERDISFLQQKCEMEIKKEKEKDKENCKNIVSDIGNEFKSLITSIKKDALLIKEEKKEEDITELFIDKLKKEKQEELEYISAKILKKDITSENIDKYKKEIKELLYSCYQTEEKEEENRIRWIVYGYLNNNNRKFEDWLPSVNSLFHEYNRLMDKMSENKIKFYRYKNSGGLIELENKVNKYKDKDNKNYKKIDKATGEEIDFSLYKDNKDISYTYTDPHTNIIEIIEPKNRNSAVFWGWETKWCTSRIDPNDKKGIFINNKFDYYYENTPLQRLYILRINGEIKYQIHFEANQCMDRNDEEVEFELKEIKLIEHWIMDKIIKLEIQNEVLLLFSSNFNLFNVVKYLVEKKHADVTYENNNGITSLILACRKGDSKIIKCLVENCPDQKRVKYVNHKDNHNETSLISSILNGNLEIVKYLVENGANVIDKDEKETNLMWACSIKTNSFEIVKYLMEKISEELDHEELVKYVNSENSLRDTSLMWACSNGNLEVIKYLVEKGANVNHENNYGETSLTRASVGNLEVVKYLVENGAADLTNNLNKSLLKASQHGNLEVVEYLVEKGADINYKDKYGKTSLLYASQNGYLEVVEYLIKKCPPEKLVKFVNHKDNAGYSSLILASIEGRLREVKYLVENGANVNESEVNKKTSLIWASEYDHLDVVKYLVEEGEADVNAADNTGNTSLLIAPLNEEGDSKTFEYLLTVPNIKIQDVLVEWSLLVYYENYKKDPLTVLQKKNNKYNIKIESIQSVENKKGYVDARIKCVERKEITNWLKEVGNIYEIKELSIIAYGKKIKLIENGVDLWLK
jgi:ankyrin repeat protein